MLKKITENVEIHQTLPDTPNLTTQELKKEWDKGCKIIKEALNGLIDELNKNMFPIGYRMFVNNDKDYSNHLGFTWQKVAKGRVLVGKDEDDVDFNAIGKVSGEKQHKLTIAEIPSHNHDLLTKANWTTIGSTYGELARAPAINGNVERKEGDFIFAAGGDQPHNNLQPYEVVNIWERIL